MDKITSTLFFGRKSVKSKDAFLYINISYEDVKSDISRMNAGNDSNPFKDQTVRFDQVSSSFHPFASSSRIELFSQESDLKN